MNIGQKLKNTRQKLDDGWGDWGGYFGAKKAKLLEQFQETAANEIEKISDIFAGVSIFVNGFTKPSSEELKKLMPAHGGIYHVYQNSSTTHIIASNLPNVKINKLGSVPIVKPSWITDSISLNKLLDYKRYLLYTNQSTSQPKLAFPVLPKPEDTPSTSKTKTASDPNFLEEFYNNSRLHLISTLGAEFKQLISDLRENSERNFPGREKLLQIPTSSNFVPQTPVIMHIDMDCFFVSVGLRKRPELRGKPVAVTHARNPQLNSNKEREAAVTFNMDRIPKGVEAKLVDGRSSMSEVASCSYEARVCGVKNGMFLGAAAKLCPDIKTIPYDFDGYREVATTLYKTIASYTLDIEAVSCDEMYVDISEILQIFNLSVEDWANHIRNEIMTVTGCPCSTGFGSNRLQARLATKKAKPSGSFHLKPDDVESYMSEISVADLPGVGRATLQKLKSLGLQTCGDVQVASLQILQKELGNKVGETILEQSKGLDKKPLSYHHERKSVSAEINYGIRFKTIEECYNFLESLGNEVWSRLNEVKMKARSVTLKLMVRATDAPIETAKFLGHGVCDCLSKSTTLTHTIPSVKIIHQEVKNLYQKLNPDFKELRGMGIQLSKLEKPAPMNPTLNKFLQKESTSSKKELPNTKTSTKRAPKASKPKNSLTNFFKSKKETPSQTKIRKEDVDLQVLKELPEDIRNEVIKEYNIETTAPEPKRPPPMMIIDKPKAKKSPFDGLEWDQLKPILYEWMKSETEPNDVDAIMLGEYFRQLAIDGDVFWLRYAMNFLHRNFGERGCLWHRAYNKIVDLLQQGMVARFGDVLYVEESFTCCL